MLRSHPFFHVYTSWWVLKLVSLVQKVSLNQLLLLLRIIILLKVRFEMLEECNLLLQLLGEVGEVVLGHDILLLICCNCFPFIVVELGATRLSNNFGGVIEKYSS